MYGYIYLTTNLVNGKKYIGQHKASEFNETDYLGSGKAFKNALNRYGKDNFKKILLECCDTKEELNNKEIEYIEMYDAYNSIDFYNLSIGGEHSTYGNVFVYNESIDDCRSIPESQFDTYAAKGYVRGMRPRTDAQKQHYRDGRKNLIPMHNDVETIYINKDDLLEYVEIGYKCGRHKPSRPNQKQEGRRWMHKGNTSKMVHKNDIQSYLDDGFEFGRGDDFIPNVSGFATVNGGPPHNKGKHRVFINNKQTYI